MIPLGFDLGSGLMIPPTEVDLGYDLMILPGTGNTCAADHHWLEGGQGTVSTVSFADSPWHRGRCHPLTPSATLSQGMVSLVDSPVGLEDGVIR